MSELGGLKVELAHGGTAWKPCMIATEDIGSGTNIGALSHIGKDVVIGSNCNIQGMVYVADKCLIGDNVFIGPKATLTNDKYPPSGGQWSPIVVKDGVVIGANATIVAGVTLQQDCVIGAGAVVTKDVPSNQVWTGNPAKFLMTTSEYNKRREIDE